MIRRDIARHHKPVAWLLCLVVAGILQLADVSTAVAQMRRPVAARGPLGADERNNIKVFRDASPAVVHITTLALTTDFFSLDVMQVPQGTGSGFVWDEQGHVVTNFHVIQNADRARVTLADQTTWTAKLVGAFPDRDLAVLRIEAPPAQLKPLQIGESSGLEVGQNVYAIGNPFGLDQTLTTGIISALNRELSSVTSRKIRGVIQTDAAINPGNSGGPLLDSAGRLIGVTTAIYSPSGGSAGIGFAIPVDEVQRIVPRLIKDGRIVRPILGLRVAPDEFRRALGLPVGVAVIGIDPGGPADQADLQPFRRSRDGRVIVGDLIVALGEVTVKNEDDLLAALEKFRPGERRTLRLVRQGKTISVDVVLAAP